MDKILKLDLGGSPRGWITTEQAALLQVKNLIAWEVGERKIVLHGGISRMLGIQSTLELSPVIAVRGKTSDRIRGINTLNNQLLFRRDRCMCLYCGQKFSPKILTRDHVIPRSKGGKDRWENVVASCKRCNHAKSNRTPEEANMPLLAIPFKPNPYESMYLSNHNILADQMTFLESRFSGNREWVVA